MCPEVRGKRTAVIRKKEVAYPVLCQNSALLEGPINQPLRVCVLRPGQGPWALQSSGPKVVIFRSIMTYHVQFLLLVRCFRY